LLAPMSALQWGNCPTRFSNETPKTKWMISALVTYLGTNNAGTHSYALAQDEANFVTIPKR
jgi:hypothetical protein